MKKYRIVGVFTGKVATLPNNYASATIKTAQPFLTIKKDSIVGDEVANTKHHGGQMRVIHQYTQKNYAHLKKVFPEIADRFIPGSFGENFVTEELTESEINIGDIYTLGTAQVQVTVCRRPCATINFAYNDDRILKEVVKTGKVGWFFRVIEEGIVKAGDFLEFVESPFPNLSLSKLHDQGYGIERFSDRDFLKRCLNTGLMDKGWKPKVEEALKANE
jgi:MOSC domain-containing protein YiiM